MKTIPSDRKSLTIYTVQSFVHNTDKVKDRTEMDGTGKTMTRDKNKSDEQESLTMRLNGAPNEVNSSDLLLNWEFGPSPRQIP